MIWFGADSARTNFLRSFFIRCFPRWHGSHLVLASRQQHTLDQALISHHLDVLDTDVGEALVPLLQRTDAARNREIHNDLVGRCGWLTKRRWLGFGILTKHLASRRESTHHHS
ncbi:TPA: hypothetical protein N0F65_008849 [Lagenidium giganteum]|uniref:Uncharacterized protein n=1 Tax=Lagenidium giganteum TaxID=4803 RepID=A0AAV2YSX1_9STRA|nr:TPA: hypothetical protein N0F65_008849 [Lagenidium giganteum]